MCGVSRGRIVGLEEIVSRGDLRRFVAPGIVRPFRPSGFDHELLSIADAAVQTKLPTALVLPVPGTNTGVLLAASVLVAHLTRTESLTAQVALVTKQLRLRSFYDSLCCKGERLVDYFPRTVVTRDGTISEIGDRPPALIRTPGRLHFVPELVRIRSLREGLNGVIVESAASDEDVLHQILTAFERRVPVIYITADPYDPILPDFEESGVVWAWDAASMSVLIDEDSNPDAICAEVDILRETAATTFEVQGPDAEGDFDRILARLWDDLGEIQHHPGGLTFETVRWAWGVFRALSQLVVPVEDYDRYARPAWKTTAIEDASRKAEMFAANTLQHEDRDYWSVLADDFSDAAKAARISNVKPEGLVRWVRERVRVLWILVSLRKLDFIGFLSLGKVRGLSEIAFGGIRNALVRGSNPPATIANGSKASEQRMHGGSSWACKAPDGISDTNDSGKMSATKFNNSLAVQHRLRCPDVV